MLLEALLVGLERRGLMLASTGAGSAGLAGDAELAAAGRRLCGLVTVMVSGSTASPTISALDSSPSRNKCQRLGASGGAPSLNSTACSNQAPAPIFPVRIAITSPIDL
jgi:hypothetical protein